MKPLLFIFICCSYALSVRATSTDSIRQYYKYVLEAEHCTIHRDLKKAASLYTKAFHYKNPFATDIYNQLLCFADLKNYPALLNSCEALVKKGAPLGFFNQSLLTDFRSSKEYSQLLTQYDDWHRQYLTTTDQQLIAYLKKLLAADQSVHCALQARHEDTAFVNHMHNNDDSLAIIIGNLMLQHNYLGEELVGALFEDDTILARYPLHGMILLHEIQRGGDRLRGAVMEAMKSGQLRSETGISWLSQTMIAKLNLTRVYHICNDTLWKQKETEEEAAMFKRVSGQTDEVRNKVLKEIYLDSEYFNIEERVVYNFYKTCNECSVDIYKSFYIAPQSMITHSFAPGTEVQSMEFLYKNCEVLAHK